VLAAYPRPRMPEHSTIFARVPPSVHEELKDLVRDVGALLPAWMKKPGEGDLVGALIHRATAQDLVERVRPYYELKESELGRNDR
jgi:hypothetical protein